jgi:hypothetical protein
MGSFSTAVISFDADYRRFQSKSQAVVDIAKGLRQKVEKTFEPLSNIKLGLSIIGAGSAILAAQRITSEIKSAVDYFSELSAQAQRLDLQLSQWLALREAAAEANVNINSLVRALAFRPSGTGIAEFLQQLASLNLDQLSKALGQKLALELSPIRGSDFAERITGITAAAERISSFSERILSLEPRLTDLKLALLELKFSAFDKLAPFIEALTLKITELITSLSTANASAGTTSLSDIGTLAAVSAIPFLIDAVFRRISAGRQGGQSLPIPSVPQIGSSIGGIFSVPSAPRLPSIPTPRPFPRRSLSGFNPVPLMRVSGSALPNPFLRILGRQPAQQSTSTMASAFQAITARIRGLRLPGINSALMFMRRFSTGLVRFFTGHPLLTIGIASITAAFSIFEEAIKKNFPIIHAILKPIAVTVTVTAGLLREAFSGIINLFQSIVTPFLKRTKEKVQEILAKINFGQSNFGKMLMDVINVPLEQWAETIRIMFHGAKESITKEEFDRELKAAIEKRKAKQAELEQRAADLEAQRVQRLFESQVSIEETFASFLYELRANDAVTKSLLNNYTSLNNILSKVGIRIGGFNENIERFNLLMEQANAIAEINAPLADAIKNSIIKNLEEELGIAQADLFADFLNKMQALKGIPQKDWQSIGMVQDLMKGLRQKLFQDLDIFSSTDANKIAQDILRMLQENIISTDEIIGLLEQNQNIMEESAGGQFKPGKFGGMAQDWLSLWAEVVKNKPEERQVKLLEQILEILKQYGVVLSSPRMELSLQ